MIFNRLLALLKIQPNEAGLAARVALFFGLVDLGRAVGGSAADALFLRRFGVEYLPYMYIGLGILTFLASLGYAVFVGRLEKRRLFPALFFGMALLLLIERAAFLLNLRQLYPVLWLTINIIAAILGIMVWTAASEVCDTRQAKRLFPIFVTSSILGGLLGSVLIGPVARLLGTENLIVLYSLLLGGASLLIRSIARRSFKQNEPPRSPSTFLSDIQAGFKTVRRTPLLQLLAVSAVLFSILYFSVSLPFSKAVASAYPDEASLAGFLGLFQGVSAALMFVAALLIANRLYARIGIVYALLILPVTYLLGFILFAFNFTLTSAIIVRLSQLTVLSGIGDGAYSAFFNVVPVERRDQVRAFDAGVPSQIGIVLSGLLSLLGERLLTNTSVFAMGMVAAVLCALVVWRMRPRYGEALAAALRAGRLDVFGGGAKIFTGIAGDLEAQRILVTALDDANPLNQRLAAEMLARTGGAAAAPLLVERLPRVSSAVRVDFLRSLTQLGLPAVAQPVMACLSDPSADVRAAALAALPALPPSARQEVAGDIRALLDDPDLDVRIQAAISLAACGDGPAASRALLDILSHTGDEESRTSALRAFEPVFRADRSRPDDPSGDPVAAILLFLKDESPGVRSAACQGLASLADPAALEAVAGLLGDPVAGVRAAAAEALRAALPASLPVLLDRLPEAPHPEELLAALPAGDPACAAPLRAYAGAELAQLRGWRDAARDLPQPGPAARFLAEILRTRAARCEQRLVKVMGLLGNDQVMRLVARSLAEEDPESRATALEALDTLGDRSLVKDLLPLLEAAPGQNGRAPHTAALIRQLHASENGWMQALVSRAASELGLASLLPVSPADSKDYISIEAAGEVFRQPGGSMDTLQTISLVERTLLLREIPLFANLTADDLVQVAETASERWYEDGGVLCRQDEMGEELFVIASGMARVTRREQEKDRFLAVRKTGEFLGEMSIIDSIPRVATVTASGDVRALVITAAAFKAILLERPAVAMGVMRGLSHRLREQLGIG